MLINDENIKFVRSLEDPYKNKILDSTMLKLHETITLLKNLNDLCDNESAYLCWNSMSDKDQIEFLINFVANHYFYLFNRSDESFSINKIDTIKSKVANFETKKMIKLLIKYDINNFIFELLDLINDRFLFEDEIFERMGYILADSELLYYDMPRNRFEDLKKDSLPSKEKIISKATDINQMIEELQFYIYCTYFRFAKKVNFEELEENLPQNLKIYSPRGYGELGRKLNKLWKSIDEDNI